MSSDDRREWLRIDDRVLLEYRLVTEAEDLPTPGVLPVGNQALADAIHKPAADFFSQHGEELAHSPLLPWMRKVDWLLGVIVMTLAQMHPSGVPIAQAVDVDLSAGGISFFSLRNFAVGDVLSLKMVLSPFTPIQTTAEIIQAIPSQDGSGYDIGTKFVELSPNDQELIIRHILQTQAERLRAKRNA